MQARISVRKKIWESVGAELGRTLRRAALLWCHVARIGQGQTIWAQVKDALQPPLAPPMPPLVAVAVAVAVLRLGSPRMRNGGGQGGGGGSAVVWTTFTDGDGGDGGGGWHRRWSLAAAIRAAIWPVAIDLAGRAWEAPSGW